MDFINFSSITNNIIGCAVGVVTLYVLLVRPLRQALDDAIKEVREIKDERIHERVRALEETVKEVVEKNPALVTEVSKSFSEKLDRMAREAVDGRRRVHERINKLDLDVSALNERSKNTNDNVHEIKETVTELVGAVGKLAGRTED